MLKRFLGVYPKTRPWLILALLGTVSWSLTMVKSGIKYPFGIGFWGPNGHDGVWHVALSESLARGNWEMPVFAGELIKNYHIGFNLLLAGIHKITQIPVDILYFQIFPPVFAILIGYFVFRFVYTLTSSYPQAFWATFFVYFGGGFGWVVTLFRDLKIDGESLFWSQQSISTLINPPFALSLVLLFWGLTILVEGVRSDNKKKLVLATFLFGVLAQIKIYAAILAIPSLFAAGFVQIIKDRKISLIKVATGALVLGVLLFSSTKTDIAATVIFRPFWFLEQLMATTDRLFWPRYAEAMVNYVLGGVWLKAILVYGFAFVIFLVGNFGTRLIAVWLVYKKGVVPKNYNSMEILILSIILAGVLIPTFFVQSGTNWNTVQFMYYSLIFSGVLSGIAVGKILENPVSKIGRLLFLMILVLLTVPTTFGTLYNHYLPARPPAKISVNELYALGVLSKLPDGVVLVQPYGMWEKESVEVPPKPLYLYESTAYVSAYAKKPVYLEDTVNLEITNYPWRKREQMAEKFFIEEGFNQAEFLKSNGIKYVYVVNKIQEKYKDLHMDPLEIYKNSEIAIYEVK